MEGYKRLQTERKRALLEVKYLLNQFIDDSNAEYKKWNENSMASQSKQLELRIHHGSCYNTTVELEFTAAYICRDVGRTEMGLSDVTYIASCCNWRGSRELHVDKPKAFANLPIS
jgi:hypothetical protein